MRKCVKAHRPDDSEVMMDDGESDTDEQVRAACRLALDETALKRMEASDTAGDILRATMPPVM